MTDKLRQAIEQAVAILGPEAPLCSGCVAEWTEALRILNDALAEPVAWRYQNMEHMAEEAECVAMCLNDRGVPVREGAKSLSLWGRVEQYAKPRFINGMHTKDPSISREHLLALAKVCGIVGNYTTREFVDSVTGYAQVVLRDPAVQEAFVEANAHMLYTAPQPARREPLTDEEVLKIWSPEPSRPVMGKYKVLTFARAIERAHGIGGQE